jgi:hypothetical protein
MIEVLIDDKVVKVNPHLTVEKYQKIMKNPIKYNSQTELLALYLDLTADELRELPVEQIRFVESALSQHLLKPPTNDIIFTFSYKGVTYGLENDWSNMKWGQWVDLEVYSQQDKMYENLHRVLALLYRPIKIENGTKYKLTEFKSSDVDERAEVMKQVDVIIWYSVSAFFLHILKEFTTRINTSLKVKMKIENHLKPILKILPKWLHPKPLRDSIFN